MQSKAEIPALPGKAATQIKSLLSNLLSADVSSIVLQYIGSVLLLCCLAVRLWSLLCAFDNVCMCACACPLLHR